MSLIGGSVQLVNHSGMPRSKPTNAAPRRDEPTICQIEVRLSAEVTRPAVLSPVAPSDWQHTFLAHSLWYPAVEFIKQKNGVSPVVFFVAPHRRIVNRIGLPDPLLSHVLALVTPILGLILLIVIGHELSIFLIIRLNDIPNVFNQPKSSLFEFLI